MPNYMVVDADQLDADITLVADSIRAKGGTSDALVFPDGFVSAVDAIQAGGGSGYTINDIGVTGAITGDLVIDFQITRGYCFSYLDGIGKVTLKAGFAGSYSTAVNNIFTNSSVTEVYDDVPDGILNFSLNPNMFYSCKSLKKAVLRNASLSGSNFSGCSALEFVDISCASISQDNLFVNCTSLKTIVLRSQTVVPLNAPTYWAFALNGTPFDNNPAGEGGTVYVPEALIEEYKVATNWSVLYEAGTCNFVAIEGSEYE